MRWGSLMALVTRVQGDVGVGDGRDGDSGCEGPLGMAGQLPSCPACEIKRNAKRKDASNDPQTIQTRIAHDFCDSYSTRDDSAGPERKQHAETLKRASSIHTAQLAIVMHGGVVGRKQFRSDITSRPKTVI